MRDYLPLIRKDYYSYVWSCSSSEGGTSSCKGLILKTTENSHLCFWMDLLHLVSYHFFLCRLPSSSVHLLMYLSLKTSTSIKRTVWPILVELIELVNCYNFYISNDLTQMVSFPTQIHDWLSVMLFWNYLFLDSICSIIVFPPFGNYNHAAVSVSIDFPSNSESDALFHRTAFGYSCADWDALSDYLRNVLCEDVFKLGTSLVAAEFCEWVLVGIGVYVPHRKNQD